MKKITLILLAHIVLVIQGFSSIATFAFGEEKSIAKEDACTLQDGLSHISLTIKNYTGYFTKVGSYYKDKKVLYYIVDAEAIQGGGHEAFLWSWDCTKKKAKQLSPYNFADYQKNETETDKWNSWIDDDATIKIVFADLGHLIIKQTRIYKGPKPADKYLVFYRSNKAVGEDFALEKFNGFQKFKNKVLGKTITLPCNAAIDKSCYMDSTKTRSITVKKIDGFRFYLDDIYTDSNGTTYLNVGYRSANGGYGCTSGYYGGNGGENMPDECIRHSFTLRLNLETGSVYFNPSLGYHY